MSTINLIADVTNFNLVHRPLGSDSILFEERALQINYRRELCYNARCLCPNFLLDSVSMFRDSRNCCAVSPLSQFKHYVTTANRVFANSEGNLDVTSHEKLNVKL